MENEISDEALLAKIEPLLETVDAVTDVNSDLASDIAIAEMSGTELPDKYRKLAILIQRKLITNEEARRFVAIEIGAFQETGERR